MNLRALSSTLLLVLVGLAPAAAGAASERRVHPPKAKFPEVRLVERRSQGERAVQLLAGRLPEVAAWYGKSPDELRALLRRDRHLRVDGHGRLFVEDELEVPLRTFTPAEDSVRSGALLPLDQTFLLHSKPGSQRTLYLNFRGATFSNTAWSAGTITAQPFDLDGVPGSFSDAELQRIQAIWQRVAEDYAPFDVNVTTQAPAADALTRSSGADQVFGTTVLITHSSGVYSCSCGGVAYLGVFDDTSDYYKPALVFYNQLGGGNEKYVAEAISHEAGHNMGLAHDGYSGGGYYPGHGSGATGWAPIMGVGYYQALVQWSKGQYSTANNVQDDYGVMASNGLVARADDHGNTPATATVAAGSVAGANTVYMAQGIVEKPGDVDMFAVTVAAGPLSVAVNPAARSANLDVLLEVRDAADNVLASANPPDALSASLTYVVPATGTYYIAIQGTGRGDPLSTGYTNYGSLGNYAVTVTAATSTDQPPTANLSATPTSGTAPLAVTLSASGSRDPEGGNLTYAWNFGDGSSGTGPTATHTYAAGTYTATLTVTDPQGLSASRSVTINATQPVVAPTLRVGGIAMSLSTTSLSTRARAYATITVLDGNGRAVSGATVRGNWSGIVSGAVSGTTNSNGVVKLASPTTRSRGTFTFTTNSVSRSGHQYDASLNTETADSITR